MGVGWLGGLYQYLAGDMKAWPRVFWSYLAKSEEEDPAISISNIAEGMAGIVLEGTTAAVILTGMWCGQKNDLILGCGGSRYREAA